MLDVAVFGGGLHVTVDDDEAADARIRAARWTRKSIAVQRLEQIEPSMEDVFVAMIEAEERKAGMSYRRTARHLRQGTATTSLRDARSLAMALAVPVMMLLLFGYALSLDVDRIPTLIYDQDRRAAEPRPDPPVPGLALLRHPRVSRTLRGRSSAASTATAS